MPARNEEAALPHLLGSLADQVAAAGQVIVIDDASEDRTAAIARQFGATVIESSGPPQGWSGKCWALHQGQEAATGSVLAFIDADVTLAPDGLARMVYELDAVGGRGLVSAEPYHRTRSPVEQMSAVCNVIALMGTGAFSGRPARQACLAFGPLLIVDRETYQLVGGHAHPEVRSKITEDLALARRTAGCDLPVAVFAGGDAAEMRMYPEGLTQLINGWTKVLATGAGAGSGSPLTLIAVILWVSGAIRASIGGVGAALRAADLIGIPGCRYFKRVPRRQTWVGPASGAARYFAWAAQMSWLMRRAGSFSRLTASSFPLPLATFLFCFARSALKVGLGREHSWRGRSLTGR